jgi:hypothetical protein
MSQPTAAPGRPPAGGEVNVPIGAIIQALHDRYGRLVHTLIQENAEAQAGLEAQAQELAYLRAVVQAQEEPSAPEPGQDAQAQLGVPAPLG